MWYRVSRAELTYLLDVLKEVESGLNEDTLGEIQEAKSLIDEVIEREREIDPTEL